MGVMKRISTARITNPELTGRREDPELAAMHALWMANGGRPEEPDPDEDRPLLTHEDD